MNPAEPKSWSPRNIEYWQLGKETWMKSYIDAGFEPEINAWIADCIAGRPGPTFGEFARGLRETYVQRKAANASRR